MTLLQSCLQFYNSIPASGYLLPHQETQALQLYNQISPTPEASNGCSDCSGSKKQKWLEAIANYIRSNSY